MEKLTDFEINKVKDKLQIRYIGNNPKIDKCINELSPKFAPFHLIEFLLKECDGKNYETSDANLNIAYVSNNEVAGCRHFSYCKNEFKTVKACKEDGLMCWITT